MNDHATPTFPGTSQLANKIPASFESRKRRILAELSVPDAEYTDLSPKGSVDEGIRDLIRNINGLSGLVTTSSCAGRVSVFLEGRKKKKEKQKKNTTATSNMKIADDDGEEGRDENHDDDDDDAERQFASTGGKGGGRWLYVSHDPVKVTEAGDSVESRSFHELFGMAPGDGNLASSSSSCSTDRMKKKKRDGLRLVHFRFEPMILHIMTATLHHAQPILTAAFSAGFRESGLQSLRCLSDDMETSPIVAVRSSGLSLESIIGYCDDSSSNDDSDSPIIHSLVTEEYLRMLVELANERFSVNTERVERFRTKLLDLVSVSTGDDSLSKGGKGRAKPAGWEDEATRRERKRAEGLARQKALLEAKGVARGNDGLDQAGDEEIATVFE
ncbi:hypothetical protein DTO271G3_3158 [Paecilomyces variotii]|nr:hypothetical protein DTO271G3_3158 [Paecilomyces variotii]